MLLSIIIAAQVATNAVQPAAQVATNSDQQGVPARQLIWNDLYSGMTKAEVKALYPKNKIELGDGCFADLDLKYTSGGLDRVNLEWATKDTNKRCGDVVTATLSNKYGQPAQNETEIKRNDCGNSYAGGLAGALAGLCEGLGGDEPDHFVFSRWFRDGIEITLKRDSANDGLWWLVYRPQVLASEKAAAKL